MTQRRWTDKPDLRPDAVRGLNPSHPALAENRTLFPSTVVEVTREAPDRLLVSGFNSRKLGGVVAKGRFAGYAMYGLTLEERATCPVSCSVRDVCYGNGMHFARRHRIGDPSVFYSRLEAELAMLSAKHPRGVLVRLHVLGDFPNAEYVGFWAAMLGKHPRLACYGYTHRGPDDPIGAAVAALKAIFPERFRIRWSAVEAVPDGTVVTAEVPEGPRTAAGIVCPAQTDATACCSSCALCWETSAKGETIVFIRHGPKARGRARTPLPAVAPQGPLRPVTPVSLAPGRVPTPPPPPPEFRTVDPRTLLVGADRHGDSGVRATEAARRLAASWDWATYRPPACVETPRGLLVVHGHETATAAASHPGITAIPVMVVTPRQAPAPAATATARGGLADRMPELRVLSNEIDAGDPVALSIRHAVEAAGGRLPRNLPVKDKMRDGDVVGVRPLRLILASHGEAYLSRVVRIGVLSGAVPVNSTVLHVVHYALLDPAAAAMPDVHLATVLAGIGDLHAEASSRSTKGVLNRYQAGAALYLERLGKSPPPAPVPATPVRPSEPVAPSASRRIALRTLWTRDRKIQPKPWAGRGAARAR